MENKKINPVGSAIILAGGYSKRMGEPKAMMEIEGIPVLARLIRAFQGAGIKDVDVITGFGQEKLMDTIAKEQAQEQYNPNFAQGMFTSVKVGIEKAFMEKHTQGCFLIPVDYPLISEKIIFQLLEVVEKDKGRDHLMVPCYEGKKGHPIWIPKKYFQSILEYNGEEGLKGALKPYEEKLLKIETGNEEVLLDMDTKEDYEEILAFLKKERRGIKGFCGRIFLIRHGETIQHQDKIFLGQADIPLSVLGEQQGKENGKRLLASGVTAKKIYCSDLKRAKDTAAIIGRTLGINIISQETSLREISLGKWDGRLIEEIKKEYPKEYQARGQSLLSYKIDVDSENYYDLQYRVAKRVRNIIEEESGEKQEKKDILIVSHAGPIKAMIAKMTGMDLQDAIRLNLPKGSMKVIEVVEGNITVLE